MTAVIESATLPLSPSCDGDSYSYGSARYAVEREGATSRFAAAQKLFKEQAASQPTAPTTSPLNRNRSGTTTSLYAKLDNSVSGSFSSADHSGTTPGSSDSSFTDAFMKTKPRQFPKPERALALASSECPPSPVDTGCILLGPRRTLQTLDVTTQIHARTASGAPAWYCRHDKLVIFDGVNESNGVPKLITRSSRGLDMARRNCPRITLNVDIPCTHCQELLKRKTWVFQERMLECRVCKTCQDRCWLEWEEKKKVAISPPADILLVTPRTPTTAEPDQRSDTSDLDAAPLVVPTPSEMEDPEKNSNEIPAAIKSLEGGNTKPIDPGTKRDSVLQDDEEPGEDMKAEESTQPPASTVLGWFTRKTT